MSVNNSNLSSRPAAITAFALVTGALGLGQAFCAGLLPDVNVTGILSGSLLLAAGIVILSVKKLWRKELLGAYLDFLAGAMFLLIAINGALGLGIAQFKISSLFVWIDAAVGLAFFFFGWLHWRKPSQIETRKLE
jgi:hypothetical protein